MATCTKGIRLARAISRNLEVWAAIPLPGGDRIVFDAELLRRVADAMDANGMTEIKAMGGLRPILAKNADTSIVAMPIRGSHTDCGRVASYEALLLDAVTGRVIAAPERSDTGDNGAEMAKTLRERADMYMKDGAALSAKKDLAAVDRIEKRIAAEDEIDALMDATTPAPEPAPEPEKPQPVAEAPAAPAAPVATPWSEHEAEWRDMTARNFHDEVRVSMAEWAAACAPSVPEFAMIAGDFRLIASRQDGDGYDVDSYMEWRNDATSELLERIARAFGADVKAGMERCL